MSEETKSESTEDVLDAELESRMRSMVRHWSIHGDPVKANRLRTHLEAGTKPEAALLSDGPLKPEKNVDLESIDVPPRNGKGSTKAAWQEFALEVADVEEEVVNRMSRDEIIKMLEVKGIIEDESDEE